MNGDGFPRVAPVLDDTKYYCHTCGRCRRIGYYNFDPPYCHGTVMSEAKPAWWVRLGRQWFGDKFGNRKSRL